MKNQMTNTQKMLMDAARICGYTVAKTIRMHGDTKTAARLASDIVTDGGTDGDGMQLVYSAWIAYAEAENRASADGITAALLDAARLAADAETQAEALTAARVAAGIDWTAAIDAARAAAARAAAAYAADKTAANRAAARAAKKRTAALVTARTAALALKFTAEDGVFPAVYKSAFGLFTAARVADGTAAAAYRAAWSTVRIGRTDGGTDGKSTDAAETLARKLDLTGRQMQAVLCRVRGMSYRDAAKQCGISLTAFINRMECVQQKLGGDALTAAARLVRLDATAVSVKLARAAEAEAERICTASAWTEAADAARAAAITAAHSAVYVMTWTARPTISSADGVYTAAEIDYLTAEARAAEARTARDAARLYARTADGLTAYAAEAARLAADTEALLAAAEADAEAAAEAYYTEALLAAADAV